MGSYVLSCAVHRVCGLPSKQLTCSTLALSGCPLEYKGGRLTYEEAVSVLNLFKARARLPAKYDVGGGGCCAALATMVGHATDTAGFATQCVCVVCVC